MIIEQLQSQPIRSTAYCTGVIPATSAESNKEGRMRSTIIISKRGAGYISTVRGKFGGGHSGARAGLTPYDAAATAARYMIEYAQSNPDGGDLMAPPEVLEHVPPHLRSIQPKSNNG